MILPLMNAKGELRLLHTKDIAYLQTNGQGKLYFYTYDEMYRPIFLVKEWAELLQVEEFVQIDRGTIVNPRMIESFDLSLRLVKIPLKDGTISIPFVENARRKLDMEYNSLN